MVHHLLAPEAVSWNAAMISGEEGKQWEQAFGSLQGIMQQRLTADAVSWIASMSACEMGNQLERASRLLQQRVHQLLTHSL